MNIPKPLEMYRYVYKPTEVVLDINGTEYNFEDGSITYINMIHQFTFRHLPVIKCGLQAEIKIIRQIYDHLDDAKFSFCIKEEKRGEDEIILDVTEWLRHTFSIIPVHERTTYITSDTIYDQSKSKEANGAEDREGEVETLRTFQEFHMYLIDLDAVNKFDQEYSDHLTDVSRAGAIQRCFMERDIPKGKIYGTPPLQTDILPNVNIPLGDLTENISELNNKYGLYDSLPIIYYDFDWYYCLNKRDPNIVDPDSSEYGTVTFILLNPEKAEREITGSNDHAETRTHWVNIQRPPANINDNVRDVNAKMSTLTTVNKSGKIDKQTVDENATRMRYIYAMNDLTIDQVMNETMHGPALAIQMQNVSAKFFRPYKDYTIEADTSYEDMDLNGHIYRLLTFMVDIQRIGSKDYWTTETCVLYRPER